MPITAKFSRLLRIADRVEPSTIAEYLRLLDRIAESLQVFATMKPHSRSNTYQVEIAGLPQHLLRVVCRETGVVDLYVQWNADKIGGSTNKEYYCKLWSGVVKSADNPDGSD